MHIDCVRSYQDNEMGEIGFRHLIVPLYEKGVVGAFDVWQYLNLRQGDHPASDSYAIGVIAMYSRLFQEVKGVALPVIAMGHL